MFITVSYIGKIQNVQWLQLNFGDKPALLPTVSKQQQDNVYVNGMGRSVPIPKKTKKIIKNVDVILEAGKF